MDELELLRALRPEPDPTPPTDRARALEALMHTIHNDPSIPPGGTTDSPTPLAPPSGRRRHARRVAMVGAAAALAIGALAVGASGNGPAPLRAEPSAAEQLRTIANRIETEGAYPATPWVRRAVSSYRDKPDGPTTTNDLREYRFANGDVIFEDRNCEADCFVSARLGGYTRVPAEGSEADVRTAIEAEVADLLASYDQVPAEVASGQYPSVQTPAEKPSRSLALVSSIANALSQPAMGPVARAELLRMLAGQPGLSVQPGVATSLGDRGTRFTAGDNLRHTSVVVDPADGYLLEVSTVDERPETAPPVTFEGGISRQLRGSDTQTWGRPATTTPWADVTGLAAAVADAHDAIEGSWGDGGCAGGGGPGEGPDRYGVDVPENLTYVHCWSA